MKLKHAFLILIIGFANCKPVGTEYPMQRDVAKKLLTSLSKNDTTGVRKLMGEEDLKAIGEDDETFNFKIDKAYQFIKSSGLPDENKYTYKAFREKDPQLVDISIPFSEGTGGSSRKPVIVIHYVKYLPPDKILDFEINEDYAKGQLERTDSVRK